MEEEDNRNGILAVKMGHWKWEWDTESGNGTQAVGMGHWQWEWEAYGFRVAYVTISTSEQTSGK